MFEVVIWGCGQGYNKFISMRGYDQVIIKAIIDRNAHGLRQIDGVDVITPEYLMMTGISFDYVIVTVEDSNDFDSVIYDAIRLGIDRRKIIPSRVFEIPFFTFNKYIEIKESNISILSDYCSAGFLYHRFALEFKSPTINMFTNNKNYLRFLKNLDLYLDAEMKEGDDAFENPYLGALAVPSGKLIDVDWYFNHDIYAREAIEKWNRRAKRFNRKNFFVIMTIFDDKSAYEFEELNIEHKLGFYWKDLGLQSVLCLPGWEDEEIRRKFQYRFNVYVNKCAIDQCGVRAVDWIKVLLNEKDYNRVT